MAGAMAFAAWERLGCGAGKHKGALPCLRSGSNILRRERRRFLRSPSHPKRPRARSGCLHVGATERRLQGAILATKRPAPPRKMIQKLLPPASGL